MHYVWNTNCCGQVAFLYCGLQAIQSAINDQETLNSSLGMGERA